MNVLEDLKFFLQNLISPYGFVSKWDIGIEPNIHGWSHIISSAVIGIAFFAIPIMLFSFAMKKKPSVPFRYLFILFSLFIFFCGTVHFLAVINFWYPLYRLSALVKFFTAILSILTAVELYRVIPLALQLKTTEELERAVTIKTKSLVKSERALKRSNEELEEFAYVATHDIQEPIRMISQNIKRLEEHLSSNLDDRSKKYLTFIEDGSELIQNLIKDLLEYSRLKSELIDFEPIDLNQVLEKAQTSLQAQIEEKNATIIIQKLPKIIGIESLMLRLFTNLINNSIKYSDPNRPPIIKITFEIVDENYKFCVKDNGIGFDPKNSDKIFKLFHRLHSKHEYSGSGIGLSACKRIIEYHDGDIWAESKPGEGSSFCFTIPVHYHNIHID